MIYSKIRSIRRYLLTFLISALIIGSAWVAISTYFYASDEIDELYDQNMIAIAETLEKQLIAFNHRIYPIRGMVGKFLNSNIEEEQEFLVQIWDNHQQLVYTSHGNISYPLQESRGKRIHEYQGTLWRTYSTTLDGVTIQVSQPKQVRDRYVYEITQHLLFPIIIFVPLLGVFIWVLVGKSLNPLHDISHAITKRSATSLFPLSEEYIPTEIQPLVQELNALLERLHTSLELQRSFTADVAHQLRTPLGALQLQLGNLKRAKNADDQAYHITKLQEGIDRATHEVQQLLTLARMEPNALNMEIVTIDIYLLAQETAKQYADMFIGKSIDLSLSGTQPVMLLGNKEHLRILLENLLSNALRYTSQGGKVNVSVYQEADDAVIKVFDNGIGIAESEYEHIFKRFYRVLGTDTEGTGLGLSIVQAIVHQHGGSIHVGIGIEGKGSGFTIIFPIKFYAS